MYFRCSIKISPCITKCLGNFVFKVCELVSKFKQHFSDKPPEASGSVRKVGIYCDCDCNDRHLSVGVEKLKEIETLMEKDSKTFIKTKTELLFGNERGDDLDLKRESETENRDLKVEKIPQTNIPIGCGIENPIIKVKLDMLVLGKLDQTPTEKGLVDEKQAENTESVTDEELSPPTQDEKQAQNTESITDEELSPPTQDERKVQNIESVTDEDLSVPTQDMIDRNHKEKKDPNQGDEQRIRFYNWI